MKSQEPHQEEPGTEDHIGPSLEVVQSALDEFEASLLVLAARITGDAERARDVVQEVFLRLCRTRRGEVEDHLAAWLHTVCRNQALDVRRKERRMRELAKGTLEEREDSNPTPDQRAEEADEVGLVLGSIAGLPEKQREALQLKFQKGLSYNEIAAAMETTSGNVGWLLHNGLKALRERLGAAARNTGSMIAGSMGTGSMGTGSLATGQMSAGFLNTGSIHKSDGSLGGSTQ